jgi:16S rRNA (uracil1498-N3)-methyltransferase
MPKLRRFRVPSLAGLAPGEPLTMPAEEARHARVLRLGTGDEVEIFDDEGREARAAIALDTDAELRVTVQAIRGPTAAAPRLILATAWPKGKRAAYLVEKCSELGVDRIVPLRCARSIVHKATGSESLARLRRIAAEAAKQTGRRTVPEIAAEEPFVAFVAGHARTAFTLMLDPDGDALLVDALTERRATLGDPPVVLLIGPEGGFTPGEVQAAEEHNVPRVRLTGNLLRVETAALAACAVAAVLMNRKP